MRREDAERLIEGVRGDEPELAEELRMEERARSRWAGRTSERLVARHARGLVEEHSVLLGADTRRAWVGLTRGIGLVDDVAVVVVRGEVDRRRPCHVMAREAERRVTDIGRRTVASPADLEAHAGGDGRRAWHEAKRVEEVVEVGDLQCVHAQARLAGCSVDLDRAGLDRDCPEQTRGSDARIEIVYLLRQVADGARKEVNSYEGERSVLDVAGRVDVRALHEAHVGIEGVRRPVAPVRRALDVCCA